MSKIWRLDLWFDLNELNGVFDEYTAGSQKHPDPNAQTSRGWYCASTANGPWTLKQSSDIQLTGVMPNDKLMFRFKVDQEAPGTPMPVPGEIDAYVIFGHDRSSTNDHPPGLGGPFRLHSKDDKKTVRCCVIGYRGLSLEEGCWYTAGPTDPIKVSGDPATMKAAFDFAVAIAVNEPPDAGHDEYKYIRQYGYDPGMCVGRSCP